MTETNYHCSIEWHLARLTNFAGLIYSFAYRLSKKSERFHCSTENLAEYFGVSRSKVSRAIQQLRAAGFFQLIVEEYFRPNVYKVLSHKEWAEDNPDRCAEKISFPWSSEKGDELGARIYNLSGGRVKMAPYKLAALRKTGLSDETIGHTFEKFVQGEINRRESGNWQGRWSAVSYKFLRYLKGELTQEDLLRLGLPPFQIAINKAGDAGRSIYGKAQQL